MSVHVKPKSAVFKDGKLGIVWEKDGHVSEFDVEWLKKYSYSDPTVNLEQRHKPILWSKAQLVETNLRVSYKDYMHSNSGLLQSLELLHDYGIAFLHSVPAENEVAVEDVVTRIGPIRETFYGTSWNVKSVPDAKNIAYTNLFLGLHMDLMCVFATSES